MLEHKRDRWVFGTHHGDALWRAGFRTNLIRRQDDKLRFAPFDWYRRSGSKVTANQQNQRLEDMLKAGFLLNRVYLSCSAEVDSLALLLTIQMAVHALDSDRRIHVVDLANPRDMQYVISQFERGKEIDLVVAHNFTIGSTAERAEKARDFCVSGLDCVKVLVAAGEPIKVAQKLYFNRFSGSWYQSGTMVTNNHGRKAVRQTTAVEER